MAQSLSKKLTPTPSIPLPRKKQIPISKTPKPSDWNSAYTLMYDAWNRLVRVKNGSKTVGEYAYNGLKWRIAKTVNGVTRKYFYTDKWQIIEERVDIDSNPDRQFVWGLLGLDNLVLRDQGDERLYAFSDYVSVTAVADAGGKVLERYGYNAYGVPQFMMATFAPITSSRYEWETLYDSYRWDSESGFYQIRNRYLHTTLGRWLTRDPLGEGAGINLYAYCENCPVNKDDASGLWFSWIPFLGTIESAIKTWLGSVDGMHSTDYIVNHSLSTPACQSDIDSQEFYKMAALSAPNAIRAGIELCLGVLSSCMQHIFFKILGGALAADALIQVLILARAQGKMNVAAAAAKTLC